MVRIHEAPSRRAPDVATRDPDIDSRAMKSSGKLDAGNPLVRFDEGDGPRESGGHPYSTPPDQDESENRRGPAVPPRRLPR